MNETFYDLVMQKWTIADELAVSEVAAFPKSLMLELTNACNLKCVFCANTTMVRKKGFMSIDRVNRVLDEAVELGIEEIALYTTGESLLHKEIFEVIAACTTRKLSCYLTSNGLLLNAERAERLCNSGLRSYKFSVDGYDPESYETLRIKGRFQRLMNNIQLLKETRDRLNSSMQIYAGIILLSANRDKTDLYESVYGPFVDSILFTTLINHGGKSDDACETLRSAGDEDFRGQWQPCRMLWDRIVVSYDGQLTACCIDFDMELTYADLDNTTLAEAWNGAQMRAMRRAHLTGDVSGLSLCAGCDLPYRGKTDNLQVLNTKTKNTT